MTHHEQRTDGSRDDWETPPEIFGPLDEEFRFRVDLAASPGNAKCASFHTRQNPHPHEYRGGGPFWLNPPYSHVAVFMHLAANLGARSTVVCLVPARTDTAWWHDYVMEAANEVRLVRGRVRFILDGRRGDAPPFPSAIVIYRPDSPGRWPSFSSWSPPTGQRTLFEEER